MNRPIKFRAYSHRKKQMYYFTLFDIAKGLLEMPGMPPEIPILLVRGELDLMLFTGVLDKNEKEIFEGDIVKSLYGFTQELIIGEVVWMNEQAKFVVNSENRDDIFEFDSTWMKDEMNQEEIEIIGNIYENPNLLKK